MSTNTNRHQAGALVAGEKTGGQFKAGERTPASGAALGEPKRDYMRIAKATFRRLAEASQVQAQLERHRQDLILGHFAARIRDIHPDAATLVIGRNPGEYGDDEEWGIAGVEYADGTQVELDPDFSDELDTEWSQLVGMSPGVMVDEAPERYEAVFEEVGEVNIDEALTVDTSRSFVDTGNLDDRSFTEVWMAAEEKLNMVGVGYTTGSVEADLESEWGNDDGTELTDEQVAALGERAAQKFSQNRLFNGGFYDHVRDLRHDAITEAAQELGMKVEQQ